MKILVNISAANVTLNEGLTKIPVRGTTVVTDDVAKSEYVQDAVNRGWIEVAKDEKAAAKVEQPIQPVITFTTNPMEGSLTFPGSETNVAAAQGSVTEAEPKVTKKSKKEEEKPVEVIA